MPDACRSSEIVAVPGAELIAGKAIACLQCRSKHLKCDARLPSCTRCQKSSSLCSYLKSRRGYNGRKRSKLDNDNDDDLVNNAEGDSHTLGAQHDTLVDSDCIRFRSRDAASESMAISETTVPSEKRPVISTSLLGGHDRRSSEQDRLLQSYYVLVHPSHPFLIPRSLFEKNPSVIPSYLKDAMCLLASHIADDSSTYSDQFSAERISEAAHGSTEFSVQALLLLALALFARFEAEKGISSLNKARELATRIGMGSETYDTGSEIIWHESWRRTWWELQTLSILAMLFHNGPTCSMPTIDTGRLLPASCDEYARCRVGTLDTLNDFRARTYIMTKHRWSSWAYKIEATAILADVLALSRGTDHRYQRTRIDIIHSRISTFLLTLPSLKQDELEEDSALDEVLYCAEMIVHLARICLHAPNADLGPRHRLQTTCNSPGTNDASQGSRSHTRLAFMSANSITKSLSMRSTFTTLTPCFSCAIAFSTSVQLAIFVLAPHTRSADLAKENVMYGLNSLQVIGRWWPIATALSQQLSVFARELFSSSSTEEHSEPWDDNPPRTISDHALPLLENEQWLDDFIAAMPRSETDASVVADSPFAGLFGHGAV